MAERGSYMLTFLSGLLPINAKNLLNQIDATIWALEQLVYRREFEAASRAYSALLSSIRRCPGLVFSVCIIFTGIGHLLVFEIGLMLIYNLPRLHNDLSSNNFFRAIFTDGKHPWHEIQYSFMILESSIYRLRHGDLDSTKFGLEDQIRSEYKNKDPVFNAFLGMTSFAKWAFLQEHTMSSFLNIRLTPDFVPSADSDESSDYQVALERLQKSINLDPSNDTYLYFLCLLQLENRREVAALGACQHFCKLNPDNPIGFLYQAKILRALDKPELLEAEVASWLRVLHLDPINDIAFAATLQHFRARRLSCAALLLVLVNRIDVSYKESENLTMWRLLAAVLQARRKALLEKDFKFAGSQMEQTVLMNRLYTWRQRYWSLEALRAQQDEMSTPGRVLVVTCAILALGKTQYSLHAIYALSETSMTDLHFHTSPFGITALLREHLSDVAKIKAVKKEDAKGTGARVLQKSLRGDFNRENLRHFAPDATDADLEDPPADAPAQRQRKIKPKFRRRFTREDGTVVIPGPIPRNGPVSAEREAHLQLLKKSMKDMAEPLPEPSAKRRKSKETEE